jgi:integrase
MFDEPEADQNGSTDEAQVSEDRALALPHTSRITVTDEAQIYHCPITHCPHLISLADDGAIIAWLNEKTKKSQSWKTHVSYHSTALAVRAALRAHGYDLFTDLSSDEDYARYVLIVQQWADQRSTRAKRQGTVTNATYNNRLAILGSLFDYAKRTRLYRGDNPIDSIQRRKVEDQDNAEPLDATEVAEHLAKINRATRAGKRDYALIGVALQTAQRGQALADMYIRDLSWVSPRLKVHFPATKGGRSDTKLLEVETSGALATYLRSYYGEEWVEKQDAPV